MRYPWLQTQWQYLVDSLHAGKLPHGIILHGLAGLGKHAFAKDFAQYLLCESPTAQQACQQCKACRQFAAKTHPDYLSLEPEEAGKTIKIDQIRELVTELALASHHGLYRVAIISPAENMNLAAANSLLKVLEEPPAQTLLILITHRISALLPTIKSRCQHLLFTRPAVSAALQWLSDTHDTSAEHMQAALAMAHGAPLAALAMLTSDEISLRDQLFKSFRDIANGTDSALPLAPGWLKTDLPKPINWMYSWASDIVKYQCQQSETIANRDKQHDLQKLAQRVELTKVLAFLDSLLNMMRLQRVTLNPQMTLEQLLVHWQTMTTSSEAGEKTGVYR